MSQAGSTDRIVAGVLVLVTVLGGVAAVTPVSAAGATATVDATPSGPNEAESTHTVVVELGAGAGSTGQQLSDIVVDYSVDAPTAGVSNVGAGTIERVGIDRGGDNMGTRLDENATITSASGMKDGAAVQVSLAGNLTLQEGDEVVLVLRPVQNPQSAGTATVTTTINSQGAADTANATVTYEQQTATASIANQTTDGETVTVDSVNLSEGGFVAIQTDSGAKPGSVIGVSEYLSAGVHEDVTVTLDEPLSNDSTVVAQSYMDTNGDQRFSYVAGGGEEDGLYRNGDDNPIGSDSAFVTVDSTQTTQTTTTATTTPTESTSTTTAEPTTTAAEPSSSSSDSGSSGGSDGSGSPSDDGRSSDGDSSNSLTDTAEPTSTTETSETADGSEDTDGTVIDSPTDSGADATTETTSPGFGVVATALALVGSAALAVHRNA